MNVNKTYFARIVVPVVAGLALCATPQARGAPKIDSQADQYLKQMCSYLAGLKAFSFSVEETVDSTDSAGQVVELSNERRVTVARPNRVAAEISGDGGSRQFFYDGKTITLFDRKANAYGSDQAPATIDAMFDDAFQRFGISVPLADL